MKQSMVIAFAVLACVCCVCGNSPALRDIWDPNLAYSDETGRCPLPPQSLQQSDLAGTWVARYADGTDTLILKEDGTYKQMYDDTQTGEHYQSDWQEWWVEYRKSGMAYLHLNGMLKCDGIGGGCQEPDGEWFDFCERQYVSMHGEVVLLVIGVSENRVDPPHVVELWQLMWNADTFPRPFLFQP